MYYLHTHYVRKFTSNSLTTSSAHLQLRLNINWKHVLLPNLHFNPFLTLKYSSSFQTLSYTSPLHTIACHVTIGSLNLPSMQMSIFLPKHPLFPLYHSWNTIIHSHFVNIIGFTKMRSLASHWQNDMWLPIFNSKYDPSSVQFLY